MGSPGSAEEGELYWKSPQSKATRLSCLVPRGRVKAGDPKYMPAAREVAYFGTVRGARGVYGDWGCERRRERSVERAGD